MSKRKSSSVNDRSSKRRKRVEEEEEEEEDHVGDVVSDAGIVESITLKNFMCHSLLGPFTFGPNVNFVVGNNGSGKSAVLTALIVSLGGNAHATNRGSSLKGFVKQGESSADVSITLRNIGKDAYKPDVYGSSITVDLKITREGLRTYKLRSKSGQIISTKKEELLSILDNFNIQVNNPVSVLTQEMSKYFLHSKGEGEKYKFFMKATQLEQMKEDFVYIKTTKHITEDKVGQHNECLKELKRKCQEKEECYRSMASLDSLRSKKEELQKQMAWALVIREWKVATLVYFAHQITATVGAGCSHRQSASLFCFCVIVQNKVEEAEEKYKQIQEKLEGITQQVQDLQPKCAELKVEAQKWNTLAVISGHEQSLNSSFIYSSSPEQEFLMRSIEVNRRNLRTLESSRSNRLRRFGEHMPGLLSAIEDAYKKGQFKQKPRGPLGFLISLKDPELALAVEVCLKGQLQAFTCDNHDDERLLQTLMARAMPNSRRPVIITSQFLPRVHDTRKRAVNHPDYPSVLQALEIEDPVVANCLIDQKGIESILLIKNRTEARRVMQGRNPPKNCNQAFSKDGDQIFTNRNYTADQTRANYLSGDVEEEIRCVSDHCFCVRIQQLVVCGIQASVAKATEISPERLDVRRTARSLDSEINRLEAKINAQQEQQGDPVEVARQYHEALESYKNMAQQMKNLNSFIKSLDNVMTLRLQVFTDLRRFLSARCKYYFDSMLSQRGYSGKMKFDHTGETLAISVQPGQGNKADRNDMLSLSGGERSFSTVCFVLSLWAITESPFRCLDEFDVYMDMVNRRISMDMMLKVAAGQRYRQFVFLTPQNMSSLPESSLIRILRLKDPDRSEFVVTSQ
uniref:Structural maintenance of chromosomes protein 6 n=1 Tax=Salarias fasciatus TaxID=181472 RepID=A0A672HHW3_SALFA